MGRDSNQRIVLVDEVQENDVYILKMVMVLDIEKEYDNLMLRAFVSSSDVDPGDMSVVYADGDDAVDDSDVDNNDDDDDDVDGDGDDDDDDDDDD